MITLRKSAARGHFDHGWLKTHHSFSFGDYFDPEQMGFRTLRVINEDIVAPGQGFPLHAHRDMEIITYILEGELAHEDSLGNRATIQACEFQRMTAGTGIRHSEFNASKTKLCHLLQIWILPAEKNLTPGYEQKSFPLAAENLRLVVSPNAEKGSLKINQKAKLYVANLAQAEEKLNFPMAENHHAWVQIVRGKLSINGESLAAGDGAAISDETSLNFESASPCEFLIFDLT